MAVLSEGRILRANAALSLNQLGGRDPETWESMVRLFAPAVFEWCKSAGVPSQDVADVVQDVFQSVALHVATFRRELEDGAFRNWLEQITRHEADDYFRDREREIWAAGGAEDYERLSNVPEFALFDDEAGDEVQLGRLQKTLDSVRHDFEERTFAAFWRTAMEGLPAPRVAADLGMTAGAVRMAKSRVMRRLREELGERAD